MTKMAKWVLAATFAVSVAGAAQAQWQPGGGGQGGLGGSGSQQPLEIILLTNADLQKELKITDDQKKTLKEVTEKVEARNKEIQGVWIEKGQKLNEVAKPAVEKALTDDQKKRLKQIGIQRMGLLGLQLFDSRNNDAVKVLKISREQNSKLSLIYQELSKEMTSIKNEVISGTGRRPDPEKLAEFSKKQKAIIDEATEKVMKVFTDDQKKAWKEMIGEPFDVSKLQPQTRRNN